VHIQIQEKSRDSCTTDEYVDEREQVCERVVGLKDGETLAGLQVLLTLGLTLGLGSWVEIWTLTDAYTALAGTKSVRIVVIGGSVVSGAVVPDSEIILVVPLEAALKIMVLSDHTEELILEVGALTISQTVNVLAMVTNSKDALPSSDRIGANNGVVSGKFTTNVEWVTTGLLIKLELLVLGSLGEEGLSICSGQTIEELLVSRREAVIDLIARSPKSVPTESWDISQLQHSIVTWNWLEGNI